MAAACHDPTPTPQVGSPSAGAVAGQEDVVLSRAAEQLVQTTLVIWFPPSDWFRNGRAAMRCKGVGGVFRGEGDIRRD